MKNRTLGRSGIEVSPLGEAGATVYVTGRGPGLEDVTAEISQRGGRGIAVRCDHADDAQVKAVFGRIQAELARRPHDGSAPAGPYHPYHDLHEPGQHRRKMARQCVLRHRQERHQPHGPGYGPQPAPAQCGGHGCFTGFHAH